eukprot:1148765-Pelagomonas_calceolata.AAC.3
MRTDMRLNATGSKCFHSCKALNKMLLASSLPIWAEATHTLIAINTIANSTIIQISTCLTIRRN